MMNLDDGSCSLIKCRTDVSEQTLSYKQSSFLAFYPISTHERWTMARFDVRQI